jgi:signal transduction histidine kinase
LTQATKAIRSGGANIVIPDVKGGQEIVDLATNFSRMNERLKASDDDLRVRSRGIAHEIRTPLAVMRARLIGVQEGVYPADEVLVASLLRQIELIDHLTTDVTLLCDTTGYSQALHLSQVDICEICEAVRYSLAPLAEKGEIIVSVVGEGVTLAGDAGRLERAISNLTCNAIQHSGGTHVTLTIQSFKDDISISCDDDGSGWPVDPPEKLLAAFVNGTEEGTDATGRTGLGLAIVNAIAKAHGGSLILGHSSLGGVKATIVIPKR